MAETSHSLIAFCRTNNRVCPMPRNWNALFEMLPNRKRTALGWEPPLPLILVLCVIVGLVYGPIAPIYNYVMQTRAPQHLRGRVVGVMGSLAYAAGPLGLILAGPLADAAGLHTTFLALSLPMLVIGIIALFLPALRRLDDPPPTHTSTPTAA